MVSPNPWPQSEPLPLFNLLLLSLLYFKRKGVVGEVGRKAGWEGIIPGDCLRLATCSEVFSRCSTRDSRWSDSFSPLRGALPGHRSMWSMPTGAVTVHKMLSMWFTQSSPKPWKVCIIIPRLQMRQLGSIKLSHLFSWNAEIRTQVYLTPNLLAFLPLISYRGNVFVHQTKTKKGNWL